MRAKAITVLALIWMMAAAPAFAVQPHEVLPDPALEARARALSAELRCMVCQNQSIDDSDAPLAADLRVLLRERLVAGDTDDEVIEFLVARYGEFILLRPRVNSHTWLLWALPPIVLVFGGFIALSLFRRTREVAYSPAPLDADEKRRLERLLDDTDTVSPKA